MMVNGETTVSIDGEEYWTVGQFSRLTGRKEGSVRALSVVGNRVRRLLCSNINGRLYIKAEELFDFPFVVKGRASNSYGTVVNRYRLDEGGSLTMVEEKLER